jgi:3-phosphoshikimate 1-carboxyvinyltransferase
MKKAGSPKLIAKPGKALHGSASLPGDKSISHRAALFAALAEGDSLIENFLVSGVTHAMLGALSALGVQWILEGTTLTVAGQGLQELGEPKEPLDCGNSATTLRILVGALAAAGVPAILTGSSGLRRRPMQRIVSPLREMGVPIQAAEGGTAPLILESRPIDQPLQPQVLSLSVASAQVKTCLLLAALAADGLTTLHEPGPSRDHTERMLNAMGVPVNRRPLQTSGASYETTLAPPNPLSLTPLNLTIPGDISAAAFLVVAALTTPGSQITLLGVGLNPTRTGLLDALGQMGADLQIRNPRQLHGEPVGDLTVRYSHLHSTQVSGALVVRMIDEFPAFAIAAAHAQGQTVVREAEELRHKESDRISAMCTGLSTLGVTAHELQDGFIISGNGIPGGAVVNPHGDHRLAMALSVAGLAADKPVTVLEADIVTESFPEFVPTLSSLGANLALKGNSGS